MKTKFLTLLSIALGFCCNACDSSKSNKDDSNSLATRLNLPADGDTISFDRSSGNPLLGTLTFSGKVVTQADGVRYSYNSGQDQLFNIESSSSNNNANRLNQAIRNTIGEGTSLSSPLRVLLDRPNAVFTAEEITKIVNTLNPAGGGVLVDPEDPTKILSTRNNLYRMRITSTEGEKRRGVIGGIYNVENSSFRVDFRAPTAQELSRFRFLTINYKIPFVTTVSTESQTVERGTFSMALKNVNNASN